MFGRGVGKHFIHKGFPTTSDFHSDLRSHCQETSTQKKNIELFSTFIIDNFNNRAGGTAGLSQSCSAQILPVLPCLVVISFFALKGRNISAQGNALGKHFP